MDDIDESFDEIIPKVTYLYCKNCDKLITKRGVKVLLISDLSTELYSTDLSTRNINESLETQKFSLCNCKIRNTFCKSCSHDLGYHVIYPCDECNEGENNSHYWLFHSKNVKAEEQKDLDWDNQQVNLKENEDPIITLYPLPDYTICSICLDLIEEAVVLSCGHTFCQICIVREIDLNRKCPIDRKEISTELIFPNYNLRQCIEDVDIYCMYGCTKIGNDWTLSKEGCTEVVKLGRRKDHEKNCKFRTDK